MAAYPLIDIYCHIYPEKFFQEMAKVSPQTENLGKRLRTITKLFDLGERFREMDCFGDYRQIISLPNPPAPQQTALRSPFLCILGPPGPSPLLAREQVQFSDRHAKLPAGAADSVRGY